jgi:hypothetical protein
MGNKNLKYSSTFNVNNFVTGDKKYESLLNEEWHASIDMVYYINLKHRIDRNQNMKSLLLYKLKLPRYKITRVEAIKDNTGFKGCTKSLLKALQLAKESNLERFIIMEDDITINVLPFTFHKQILSVLKHPNIKFDMFLLSMIPVKLQHSKFLPFLYKLERVFKLSSFIIDRSFLNTMINICQQSLYENIPHDVMSKTYQKIGKWYGFFPPIAHQLPGFSNVTNNFENYKPLEIDGDLLQ